MKREPLVAWVFDALGVIFWLAAVFILLGAVRMGTTVPNPAGDYGPVANMQLMHIQMMGVVFGCAGAIVGTLFLTFAAVIKRLPGE